MFCKYCGNEFNENVGCSCPDAVAERNQQMNNFQPSAQNAPEPQYAQQPQQQYTQQSQQQYAQQGAPQYNQQYAQQNPQYNQQYQQGAPRYNPQYSAPNQPPYGYGYAPAQPSAVGKAFSDLPKAIMGIFKDTTKCPTGPAVILAICEFLALYIFFLCKYSATRVSILSNILISFVMAIVSFAVPFGIFLLVHLIGKKAIRKEPFGFISIFDRYVAISLVPAAAFLLGGIFGLALGFFRTFFTGLATYFSIVELVTLCNESIAPQNRKSLLSYLIVAGTVLVSSLLIGAIIGFFYELLYVVANPFGYVSSVAGIFDMFF